VEVFTKELDRFSILEPNTCLESTSTLILVS